MNEEAGSYLRGLTDGATDATAQAATLIRAFKQPGFPAVAGCLELIAGQIELSGAELLALYRDAEVVQVEEEKP